jgi:hypothetical protein
MGQMMGGPRTPCCAFHGRRGVAVRREPEACSRSSFSMCRETERMELSEGHMAWLLGITRQDYRELEAGKLHIPTTYTRGSSMCVGGAYDHPACASTGEAQNRSPALPETLSRSHGASAITPK